MSEWMTPQEVSDLTGITVDNLKKLRYERRGMPYYKPTLKTVLYDRSEVEKFIRSKRVEPARTAA